MSFWGQKYLKVFALYFLALAGGRDQADGMGHRVSDGGVGGDGHHLLCANAHRLR